MKKFIAISLLTCCFSSFAFATGSTYCKVDNDEIALEVNLTNGRLFGNPIVDGQVSVLIKKNTLAVGLTSYTFENNKGEIPYWFNLNKELKLGAYAEPEKDTDGNPIDAWVSMSVVIDAMYVNGGEDVGYYIGKYTVTQESNSTGAGAMSKSFEGTIKCDF